MASFWSQPAWLTLHLFTYYQTVPQDEAISLFVSYSKSMPCPQCRKHMKHFMKEHPINSSTNLFAYGVALHNDVNLRQGKKTVSLQEAKGLIKQYTNHFLRYKKKNGSILEHVAGGDSELANRSCIGLALLCVILIIALIVVVVRQRRGKISGGQIRDTRFSF